MESARCRAFLESVNQGSFRAAAEVLGYTPSAVSQLVAALEKELDLILLIRTKRGVILTPEGKTLLPVVRSYLDREEEVYNTASELKGISKGSIVIAAYPSIAITWLPEIVRRFQNDYPGVNIKIMEGVRQEIYDYLDQHEADIGFMAYVDSMPYEWIPLAEEEIIAAIPENHPLAVEGYDKYPVSRADQDPFIMTSWGNDTEILEIFRRHHLRPHIKYTTYDTPATLAMVRMGLGISFVNELSAQYWNDHLVKIPLDPPEKVTFGIAYTSFDYMTTAAKRFLEYSVRHLTQPEQ